MTEPHVAGGRVPSPAPALDAGADAAEAAWRALATLSQANRVLVRVDDEQVLRQQICDAIVRAGGYAFAWFGQPMPDEGRTVRPVAVAGDHHEYLDEVTVSWGDGPLGRGPTGTAMRTGQTQVRNDLGPDPDYRPWLAPATQQGFRSAIALPVFVRGEIDGALMVYAYEAGVFDDTAQALLEDLAADLGFGLSRLLDARDHAQAQVRLAESEHRYRLLAENTSDVVMLGDQNLHIKWASPSTRTVLGWEPREIVGMMASDFIHPDDIASLREAVRQSERNGESLSLRYRWRCADGSYRWVDSAGSAVAEEGNPSSGQRVVRLRDVEQQVRAEQELQAREEQYRLLAENASDVVWQIAPDGLIGWASQSTARVLGWRAEDLISQSALSLVHPDDQPIIVTMRGHVLAGESTSGEVRVRKADAGHRWMEVVIHPVETQHGIARIAALRDIEEEVRARSQLEFALGHDQLTGLAVRHVVLRRIGAEQQRMVSPAALLGVLSIGIDGLTTVNEGLSYGAGDMVITTVAARLAEAAGGADQVGRGSGDEFLVLLPELVSVAAAAQRADELRQAVQGPLMVAGVEVLPTVSIGIAVGGRSTGPEQLLHEASLALREAKHLGRNRCAFSDERLGEDAQRRVALEKQIREGLQAGEFVPWFQPIARLDSQQVVGYEALVRWQRGDRLVQPGEFLPVAEATTLICDLDVAVMRQAIEAMVTLPEQLFVAVNVSTVTLTRTPYASLVAEALAATGVSASRLHLEVTETALLTLDEHIADAIADLADAGVHWYVDDFGTGYSSISHLRDLPVVGLKLDRSFTAGIDEGDNRCLRLADALIGLARGLALDSVAEGIETAAEAAVLATQGWVHGQGWLFGRPAPLAALANPRPSVDSTARLAASRPSGPTER